MSRVLSPDGQGAMDLAPANRVMGGLPPRATNAGGCCKARERRPLSQVEGSVRETGGFVAEEVPAWGD